MKLWLEDLDLEGRVSRTTPLEYEQAAPGIFVRAGVLDDTTAALASIALRRPDATICLLSALAIHDLTDEIPVVSDIALPRGAHPLRVRYAPIAWHFCAKDTFSLGRIAHELAAGIEIGLYGPERTLIDVFRLWHQLGSDIAHESLRRWLRRRTSSPGVLLDMAKSFPMARPAIQAAFEVLL